MAGKNKKLALVEQRKCVIEGARKLSVRVRKTGHSARYLKKQIQAEEVIDDRQ